MTRPADWQVEAWEALKSENWNLNDGRCPVRVTPIEREVFSSVGGYFTLCKCLYLRTPEEIEKGLGFLPGHLATGARIYKFSRLSQISEYEYELTAKYPGGMSHPWMVKGKIYPEGDNKIDQWRLLAGINVRVQKPFDLQLGKKLTENDLFGASRKP